MSESNILHLHNREAWRAWLSEHFKQEKEVWLVLPKKSSKAAGIPYNDAVEEALCFGWIDSIVKTFDQDNTMQRFTPRHPKTSYSQANKERLRWLDEMNLLHPEVKTMVKEILEVTYQFPADIMHAIQEDPVVWKNFKQFSPAYQRIRVAYIDGARKRPEEFRKRLANFIHKTRENKVIGYGGIEKYY